MAFTDLGSLGATGSSANNQATLVLTTIAAVAVGELIVVVCADDNNSSSADADGSDFTGVTDSAGNTYTKARSWSNKNAAAQAGASCAIFYSVAVNALASGQTITVTFVNATLSDATGMTARHFSTGPGSAISVGVTNTVSGDAVDPPSLDATTANREALRVRGIASEVGNNTNLTPTANWTAWANGNSAVTGTTAEMTARAEHRISTGTSDPSDPTYVAADNASVYVAFYEDQVLAPSLFTDSQTFYGPTVALGGGGAQELLPGLYSNGQTFPAPAVLASYGLTPGLFTDGETFFAPLVASLNSLVADLFTDGDTLHIPVVAATYGLTPDLFTNILVFYGPTVQLAGGSQTLLPDLFTDTDAFPAATVTAGYALAPALFTDGETFFAPVATTAYSMTPGLFTDDDLFYSPAVEGGGPGGWLMDDYDVFLGIGISIG